MVFRRTKNIETNQNQPWNAIFELEKNGKCFQYLHIIRWIVDMQPSSVLHLYIRVIENLYAKLIRKKIYTNGIEEKMLAVSRIWVNWPQNIPNSSNSSLSHETAQIWCLCFGLPKLTCVKFWRIKTSSDYSAFKVSMFMKRTLLEWNVLTIFSYFSSELNLYWNSMNWKLNGIVTMGIEKMWVE